MTRAREPDSARSRAQRERIRAQVRRLTGIEMPEGRDHDLEQAVADGLAATGARDVEELIALLASPSPSRSRPALAAMIPSLTVGETHFFRNRPQMEALARDVLPEIIERRRPERRLRIWSAGCASGEEAYSVAMMIDGLLPEHREWDLRIVGTDLDPEALEKARRAVYGSWSFREVPENIVRTYFTAAGSGKLALVPGVREMVELAPLNLITADYGASQLALHSFDLILCRNVLIYFREEAVRDVVGRLEAALVPGGWLVVGHVEPSLDVFGSLETVNPPGTIVYRRSDPVATARRPAAVLGRTRIAEPRAGLRAASPRSSTPVPAAGAGEEAHTEARRLAASLRWEEAQNRIDQALSASPLKASAHLLHGLVLTERGRHGEALAALRRCLFLDPTLAVAHLALSSALLRVGQVERAGRALSAAASLASERPPTDRVPEGEGLTWGRFAELVAARRALAP